MLGLSPEPWTGVELAFERFRDARRELRERRGIALTVNWMMRADLQVADVWGDAGWALRRYAGELDEVLEAGDFVGLHAHPLREEHGTEDFRDEQWTVATLTAGLDAYEEHFGRPPTVVGWGRGWTSDALVGLLNERGVAIDMSAAPGRDRSVNSGSIELVADVPDLSDVPRRPYFPSADDWRRPADRPGNGTWILPFSTSQMSDWLGPAHRAVERFRRRTRHRVEHDYLWATTFPGFAPHVRRRADADNPYITLNLRASRLSASRPHELVDRLVAVADAVAPFGGRFSDPVTIVERVRLAVP